MWILYSDIRFELNYLGVIKNNYDNIFTGNGYIPTTCLREILRELDDQLTDRELDMMIEEIDTDGSGTVDFDGNFYYII